MKVLFIGGTGNISSAVSRLAVAQGIDLYHLNRGQTVGSIDGVHTLRGDIHSPDEITRLIEGHRWDAVVNWIAFRPEEIDRDLKLFSGRTRQYIFISSASVYQKPPSSPIITESTPLGNPFWDYSRDKIACEDLLLHAHRSSCFPVTIVRPSLTYDTVIPLAIGGWTDYTIIDRLRKGKPVVVPGDGTSLWTVTHSSDFAVGFVGLLGNEQAIGQAFHITSDEVLTWNQIYQATAAAAESEAKLVHIPSEAIAQICEKIGQGWIRGSLWGDKSWSLIFDNSKIKRFVPDFVASTRYAQGIQRTIAWFEADPGRCKLQDDKTDLVQQILDEWTSRRF